jgi:Trk K+ transport system NAD-binding subunit
MEKVRKNVLILGSGRLAYQVLKGVESAGHYVVHIPDKLFGPDESHLSLIERMKHVLNAVDLSQLHMAYVLDDHDDHNLKLIISLMALNDDLPITASLFNENIIPHLHAAHDRLRVLNPARIASSHFVNAVYQPLEREVRYQATKPQTLTRPRNEGRFVKRLVFIFLFIMLVAATYFHFAEGLPWFTAFYFVVVTVSTVGYGDINLLHASDVSKMVGMLLIFFSTISIWLIFSLTIDRIIKNRTELSLGHRRYREKDHIVLCGLGRLGYFIADALHQRGERMVIIEADAQSPNVHLFRHRGIPVYIGNARLPQVLLDVRVQHAKALISVIDDDYGNLEIGLNARSFEPGLRVILRIFDNSMARVIHDKLDIHLTASVSAIVDDAFLEELDRNE